MLTDIARMLLTALGCAMNTAKNFEQQHTAAPQTLRVALDDNIVKPAI
jgi:hypothetical protein